MTAQHAAEGGVLGTVEKNAAVPRGRHCFVTASRAPGKVGNGPEPRSGGTSNHTDSSALGRWGKKNQSLQAGGPRRARSLRLVGWRDGTVLTHTPRGSALWKCNLTLRFTLGWIMESATRTGTLAGRMAAP